MLPGCQAARSHGRLLELFGVDTELDQDVAQNQDVVGANVRWEAAVGRALDGRLRLLPAVAVVAATGGRQRVAIGVYQAADVADRVERCVVAAPLRHARTQRRAT